MHEINVIQTLKRNSSNWVTRLKLRIKKNKKTWTLKQCVHCTKRQAWQAVSASATVFYRLVSVQLSFQISHFKIPNDEIAAAVCFSLKGACWEGYIHLPSTPTPQYPHFDYLYVMEKRIIVTSINKSNNLKHPIVTSMEMNRINQRFICDTSHRPGEQTGQ